MRRLTLGSTNIAGVISVSRASVADDRGAFARLFCADELADAGWTGPIAQVNVSFSKRRGTIRGMHYQLPPAAEMKLISCTRGMVLDVAVDLRADSPTFLAFHSEHLSAEQGGGLIIPPGCAHGFQTLTDDVELIYCHSQPFDAHAERGLNPFDERLAIPWPEPVSIMSDRDRSHPRMAAGFEGVVV